MNALAAAARIGRRARDGRFKPLARWKQNPHRPFSAVYPLKQKRTSRLELYEVLALLIVILLLSRREGVAAAAEAVHAVHTGWASGCRHLLPAVRNGRHARVLLAHERVVPRSVGCQSLDAGASGVDESARCCVLGRNTKLASVAEGVHAVSSGQKRIKLLLVLAKLLLRLLGLRKGGL